MQDIRKDHQQDFVRNVQQNLNETDREPNLYVKSENEMRDPVTGAISPREPSMQLNGNPNIAEPLNKNGKVVEFTILGEEEKDSKKVSVAIKRLPVAKREAVALLLLQMFKELNLISSEGIDLEKFEINADYQTMYTAASYMREIAPVITGYSRETFEHVSFSDMLQFLNVLLEVEIGLVRTIEDFFSTASQNTPQ